MKANWGSPILVIALSGVSGLELATHSVGNDAALLKLGALPDNGELKGQYWRFATYSFLHFNLAHLVINTALILWIGQILERRIGTRLSGAIYFCSVLWSAIAILLVHSLYPKTGATVGASGGVFGVLGAAIIVSYRRAGLFDQASCLRARLWLVLVVGLGISFLPGISMAGHIGGLIGGLLLAIVLKMPQDF
jgi:rhomboid protease GluP